MNPEHVLLVVNNSNYTGKLEAYKGFNKEFSSQEDAKLAYAIWLTPEIQRKSMIRNLDSFSYAGSELVYDSKKEFAKLPDKCDGDLCKQCYGDECRNIFYRK